MDVTTQGDRMLTAKLENLIVSVDDLKAIHNDSRILKSSLPVVGGSLFIANNAHAGLTDQYQLLAKGIVYFLSDEGKYTLVSMPYVKFYNSFEDVCIEDLKNLDYDSTEIVKKQDGSLISRFVWKGQVYFATRGNILTPDKLFYNPVMKLVLLNHTGMETTDTDLGAFEGVTYLMEYVGPSNVILEPYEKDELIGLGVHFFNSTSESGPWELRCYRQDPYDFPPEWNLKLTPIFNGTDPQRVLDSMTGLQEGVIVNYLKFGKVVYRVKFKHEDYIKALKSRSFVDKLDPIILLIENGASISTVLYNLDKELSDNPFREELVHAVEMKLRTREVKNKFSHLLDVLSQLKFEAEALKFSIEDGASRKEIYENASKFEYKGHKFPGVLMNLIYKDMDNVSVMKAIYKIVG